ncbi:hypothetical protein SISNIDRAFT_485210 [Sistotremastrum niveocremeum HHB9708]|uniref:F-box domain-containing protein n=1 Tax=Sistotremastrum niveocremeum HHB9708 TaxID=1314777 RepID=A0A164UW82_9AGAM|nr:hypothetical protein SISNIDRAFT_485210 [Sistotremastrum niveocremeum HHB9708]
MVNGTKREAGAKATKQPDLKSQDKLTIRIPTDSSISWLGAVSLAEPLEMPFNTLPDDVLFKIVECYMSDRGAYASAKTRLRHTLLLGQIEARLRAFVCLERACHHLWSTIYLQWPNDAVDLYLQRSQGRPLTVFLNTLEARGTRKHRSDQQHWTKFLLDNMSTIAHLDLFIHNNQCSQRLALAIDTAAPVLQSCRLNVAHKVEIIAALFAGSAPQLASACIYATHTPNLRCFPTLRVLKISIEPSGHQRLLSTLSALPALEDLSVIGAPERFSFEIATEAEVRVSLPACRLLTVKNMESFLVHSLLASLMLPAITKLAVHEKLIVDQHGLRSPSMTDTFPFAPLKPITPTFLRITLHPDRILFVTDGSPEYVYAIDWRPLYGLYVVDEEGIFLALLVAVVRTLAAKLCVEPRELTIQNHLPGDGAAAGESPLQMVDLTELWRLAFQDLATVEVLRLSGNITATLDLLDCSTLHLPHLSRVEILEGTLVSDAQAAVLAELGKKRMTDFSFSVPEN